MVRLTIVGGASEIRRFLHFSLFEQGFDISEAGCAEEAITLARAIRVDAMLLPPDTEFCCELRRLYPRLAILVLAAPDKDSDPAEALNAGADDFIAQPVGMRELAARIRTAVRRLQTAPREIDRTITIGSISLCPVRRVVRKLGEHVHLTPREFDLLLHLMSHPGLPVCHGRLLSLVWGPDYSSQVEYLRTFVRQLRRKLEDNPAEPRYILTENQLGYRFAETRAA
jgi:two-component system KDP operon response regulator KdpE